MEKRMTKKEVIQLLSTLKIDIKEFWVLSSGALVLRGIYPDAGDIDLAVTEEGYHQLSANYPLVKNENGCYQVTDRIEVRIDEKEDWKVEKYGEYLLENIFKYYAYLKESERKKDKARIPLVEEYIRNKNLKK